MQTKKRESQSKRLKSFENLLRSRLEELRNHVDQLRREMVVEDEVDDEATQAFRSHNREFVMTTMEREIRNISEIEQALERITKKEYGVCVACEKAIPDNRLQAIPWTRLCVDCAGGGIIAGAGPFGKRVGSVTTMLAGAQFFFAPGGAFQQTITLPFGDDFPNPSINFNDPNNPDNFITNVDIPQGFTEQANTPEPSYVVLLVGGMFGLALLRMRRAENQ